MIKVDRSRSSSELGATTPRAAVGDRLQVPARGAHGAAEGDRHPHRPHRQGDAVRGARAGLRGRRHDHVRHAAQRGRGARARTFARATHVIVRRAGDVIPEIVGPVLAKRKKSARKWKMPSELSLVRDAARAQRGRGRLAVPEQARLPRPGTRVAVPLRRPRRDGHRAPRLHDGDALLERGADRGSGRHLRAGRARSSPRSPGFKDKSIRTCSTQIEASKDRPLWRLLVGLNIRHVGAHVAQVLARAFGSIDALMAATEDEIDAVPEIGPEIAATVREWFDEEENVALIEKLRAAGVRMAEPVVERHRPEAARGADDRADRRPGDPVARGGDRGGAGGRGAGGLERVARRRASSWPARIPARSTTRRWSSASSSSTSRSS